jgi:hypothetical protein
MEMKAAVVNHSADRMVAIAIAVEWDPDMERVPDSEADVVNQDTAIAQEATGVVEVDVVNRVMAIARVAVGVVEVEKAAIWGALQEAIQMISI